MLSPKSLRLAPANCYRSLLDLAGSPLLGGSPPPAGVLLCDGLGFDCLRQRKVRGGFHHVGWANIGLDRCWKLARHQISASLREPSYCPLNAMQFSAANHR